MERRFLSPGGGQGVAATRLSLECGQPGAEPWMEDPPHAIQCTKRGMDSSPRLKFCLGPNALLVSLSVKLQGWFRTSKPVWPSVIP